MPQEPNREDATRKARNRRQRRKHAQEKRKGYRKLRQNITPAKRRRVFTRDGWVCVYCGDGPGGPVPVELAHAYGLSIDHILPVSKGGRSNEENLCTACPTCNNDKGNALPE